MTEPTTEAQLLAYQAEICGRVELVALSGLPRFVVGVDAAYVEKAYVDAPTVEEGAVSPGACSNAGSKLTGPEHGGSINKRPGEVIAAACRFDRRLWVTTEEALATDKTAFAYRPGFLAFREAPAVLAAIANLTERPELVICDGHGYAHPNRAGLACHIGVASGVPTVGCAKNHLIGDYDPPGDKRGSWTPLVDSGEVVGAVVRTVSGVKPVFVSPGHLCDVAGAVDAVLAVTRNFRLPETTRAADHAVREAAKRR